MESERDEQAGQTSVEEELSDGARYALNYTSDTHTFFARNLHDWLEAVVVLTREHSDYVDMLRKHHNASQIYMLPLHVKAFTGL